MHPGGNWGFYQWYNFKVANLSKGTNNNKDNDRDNNEENDKDSDNYTLSLFQPDTEIPRGNVTKKSYVLLINYLLLLLFVGEDEEKIRRVNNTLIVI